MIYLVRFVRKDDKPDEEYYYRVLSDAIDHFMMFENDDSGLYKTILLLGQEGMNATVFAKFTFSIVKEAASH